MLCVRRGGSLFLGYAVLALAAGWIACRHLPETAAGAAGPEEGFSLRRPRRGTNRDFAKLLVVVFISAFSSSMAGPLLLIYLQDRFTEDIGILAAAYLPAALVGSFLPPKLGKISDRIGRVWPMMIGSAASGAVFLAFPYVPGVPALAVLWVMDSIGSVMASPAEKAMVADLAGNDIRGSAYGVYLFVESLGAAAGPLLGGWLYDSLGHEVPFCLNGAVLLADALLTAVFFRKILPVPRRNP